MSGDILLLDSAGDTSHGSGKAPASTVLPFLQTSALIARLESNGIVITRPDVAEFLVECVGYSHLMSYVRMLTKCGIGSFDIEFLKRVVCVDGAIRMALLSNILTFELIFKTRLATALAGEFGPYAHLDTRPFADVHRHANFLRICEKEKQRGLTTANDYARHHLDAAGNLPVWVQLDIVSFGTISKLYENLAPCDTRREVARGFGIDHFILRSWLKTLVSVRNACAHGDVLYARQLDSIPRWARRLGECDRRRLFSVALLLAVLLGTCGYVCANCLVQDFVSVAYREPYEAIAPMGFPEDWVAQLCERAGISRSPWLVWADAARQVGCAALCT